MKVSRVYGKENRPILCNVPSMLPGDVLTEDVDFTAPKSAIAGCGDFLLNDFMARYLAGNRSLKQARSVSRKRLALVASGVGYLDPEAMELHQQIQRYNQAKKLYVDTEKHCLQSILALNRIIAPEIKKSGQLRKIQNWVGGKSIFKARYVCPPPELVQELMLNWLEFINDTKYDVITRTIVGHGRLVTIHPFLDGNGRTARLFMDAMLSKVYGDVLPLLMYRFSPSCESSSYVAALELLNEGEQEALKHSFWHESIQWNENLLNAMNQILKNTISTLQQKTALSMMGLESKKLLNHLWRQPIVCKQGLLGIFDMDVTKVERSLNELSKIGIIKRRVLREPQNAVIFDCPIIFSMYHMLDETIASELS